MPKHIDADDLPEDIARLAQAQVAAGLSADVEGAIRAGLVARQRRYDAKMAKLRAALIEGEESGEFQGDPFASVRAELGLTPR